MQEITRRVNLRGIWQAAYTAGVVLPKPVATAQYWHRSLNPKKLIGVGFSRLAVSSRPQAQPRQLMLASAEAPVLERCETERINRADSGFPENPSMFAT